MKFTRILNGKSESHGIIDGDTVRVIHGSIFGEYTIGRASVGIEDAVFLPPLFPVTLACFGGGVSYVKSSVSLSSGGEVSGARYYLPRLGFVMRGGKSHSIFGVTCILDFSGDEDFAAVKNSNVNHTIISPITTAPEYDIFINGERCVVSIDRLHVELSELLTVPVNTGDIFAAALTRRLECSVGDTITMVMDGFLISGHVT